MKNPTLLKANVTTAEEALEIIDYLYGERIDHKGSYEVNGEKEYITWFENENNNSCVAKWTKAYKNIMISEDFINGGK